MRWQRIAEGKHPREPHWYLALLGVDPALQGRGFGPHLMQPVLDRCDSDRLPAYLETDTEAQRGAVRAPRLRGHRALRAAGRWAAGVAHVEEPG